MLRYLSVSAPNHLREGGRMVGMRHMPDDSLNDPKHLACSLTLCNICENALDKFLAFQRSSQLN